VEAAEYNAALTIKAKVTHRLGEFLAKTVKPQAGAGRPKKIGSSLEPISDGKIPDELEDTRPKRIHTSSRTKKLAAVPWEEIKEAIDGATAQGHHASLPRLLRERKGD
jgi:hypothetical protein